MQNDKYIWFILIILLYNVNIHNIYATTINKYHCKHKIIKHKHHHEEQGIASFYGINDGFQHKKMANGEKFNTFNLTAAHHSLPFGSKVKVINKHNRKFTYVIIKDRIPKHNKRIIDLSFKAAKYLNIQKQGLACVTIIKVSNKEFYRYLRNINYKTTIKSY